MTEEPRVSGVVLGGRRTGLRSWGSRTDPAVVAAHSAGLDTASLDAWGAAAAGAGHHVVAADLRGHGTSTALAEEVTLDAMADDLIELAGSIGLVRPRLIGISMGGVVAGLAAARAAELWADLTIVSSPPRGVENFATRATARVSGMKPLVESTLQRWFTDDQIAADHLAVLESRRTLDTVDPGCWDATWLDFARFAGWTDLRGVLDVRCIAGELDVSTPPTLLADVAEQTGGRLDIITGAPHQLLMTHPDEALALWL